MVDSFWWTFLILGFVAYIFTLVAIGSMMSNKKERE